MEYYDIGIKTSSSDLKLRYRKKYNGRMCKKQPCSIWYRARRPAMHRIVHGGSENDNSYLKNLTFPGAQCQMPN
jgi:hypothetical protein